jgi:hypothetical protein
VSDSFFTALAMTSPISKSNILTVEPTAFQLCHLGQRACAQSIICFNNMQATLDMDVSRLCATIFRCSVEMRAAHIIILWARACLYTSIIILSSIGQQTLGKIWRRSSLVISIYVCVITKIVTIDFLLYTTQRSVIMGCWGKWKIFTCGLLYKRKVSFPESN